MTETIHDPSLEALVGQVADEYLCRQRRGESPTVDEYLDRYPEAASLLRGVLASLEMFGTSAGGKTVLGPAGGDGLPTGTLGDFHLLQQIGQGGMGLVYEAVQISLGRRVALKVLPFAAMLDPRQLLRFQNEARAAACLHHPHIVPVYAVGCERGVHYYAMQFIEGQSLDHVLQEQRQPDQAASPLALAGAPDDAATAAQPDANGPTAIQAGDTAVERRGAASSLPAGQGRAYFRRVSELMTEAAEALEYAHQSGVIHRDIKPANLLLDAHGKLWITDFGLAQIQSDARLTMTGDLVGTLRYMSPEQALAKRVVIDHRTDIYSLGATLYELLTLQPAFSGQDRQELLRQIAFEEPQPSRRLNRAIPAELETITAKAMEKNPADRYASMQELADDLKRFLKDEPIRANRGTLLQKARKLARRHQAVVTTAAVALFVVLAVLAVALGWVLRDRALREGETKRAVDAALKEADDLQTARKVPEALARAKQAAAILASGTGTPALDQRVQERLRDLQLVSDLEELRAQRAAGIDLEGGAHTFSYSSADRNYAQKFRAFGLDVEIMRLEETVERLRASTVPIELAGALDDWSFVARKARPKAPEVWKRLIAISRAADQDSLRNQVREVLAEDKTQPLKTLATSVQGKDLSPATVIVLGHALLEINANDEAAALLALAQRRYPGDFWINFVLALALGRQTPPQRAQAIRFYTAAVAVRPDSWAALNKLGIALRHSDRPDEAIAVSQKAIRILPEYLPLQSDFLDFVKQQGRLDDIIAQYRELAGLQTGDALTHRLLGYALLKKGLAEDAVADFEKAIELKPHNPLAYSLLASAFKKAKQSAKAEAAMKKALEQEPGNTWFHHEIAWDHFRRQEWDAAIAAWQQALRLFPENHGAYGGMGRAYRAKGQSQDALAALRVAVRLRPDYTEAHYFLARLLVDVSDPELHDWKQAEESALIAAHSTIKEWQSFIPDAWNVLGIARYRTGNWKAAIEAMDQATRSRKEGAKGSHLFIQAMAHCQLGDKQQARALYNQGVERREQNQKPPVSSDFLRFRAEAAALLGVPPPMDPQIIGKDK